MKSFLYTIQIGVLLLLGVSSAHAQNTGISGKVTSPSKEVIDYATVYLEDTNWGCSTNAKGEYTIEAPEGNYVLIVSSLGYKKYAVPVVLERGKTKQHNAIIAPLEGSLNEVIVSGNNLQRVKESPYNVVAIDTKGLENTTKTLSEALMYLPGMKLRESGGVGSDIQIMLDGFSGKHVKIFIDEVPQEGVGGAFGLNNIPVNFAERIEVYRGVVPVGFGTDALGGVINIVTNKTRRKWFVDASYSYGSFNTHRSYVNFGQSFKNGFIYEVNAFQNYSDNNYHINTYVTQFSEDGKTSQTDENKIERVKRFNDTYHNETVAGKFGFVGKSFADRLLFGFTYANFYKEIQTGVRQEIVFGEKHRKGHSLMPSLEYQKRNLFTDGLNVNLTANYNHNLTQNIDTSAYQFNWYGQKRYVGSAGEQSYQDNESKNTNWNGTFKAVYHINKEHTFTFSHTLNALKRTTRSHVNSSSVVSNFSIPKETQKNISGLSYRFMPSNQWNLSAFGKYYDQRNEGPVSQNSDGVGNYVNKKKKTSTFGYGVAGSCFLLKDLQVKASYEKAYRLPSNDELFGDEDLEAGQISLKPEKSHNYNLNVSYMKQIDKHGFYLEGGLIYRDSKDYIRRTISNYTTTYYGTHVNHGKVKTKGYNLSLRYNYSHWLSVGGTYNNMEARDYEKYLDKGMQQASLHYKTRIPNQPYRYANVDASFHWRDLLEKGNLLIVTYDCYYQHTFPLYWENIGDASTKKRVPEQFSHNMGMTYSLQNGRYNLSFECKNLTNDRLYDNFSLQKAGRAFYGKVRVYFGD